MSRGPTRRIRSLLSDEQLLALDVALIAAYEQHRALCVEHPVAAGRISRPGIPASFSESLAAVALPQMLERPCAVAFGGHVADLVATTATETLSVEVKASGVSRFQELKRRDMQAAALVWVDFGRRYVDGTGPVTFYLLPEPRRYEPPRRKLTLDVYLAGVSELAGFRSLAYADVRGVLAHSPADRAGGAAPRLPLSFSS